MTAGIALVPSAVVILLFTEVLPICRIVESKKSGLNRADNAGY